MLIKVDCLSSPPAPPPFPFLSLSLWSSLQITEVYRPITPNSKSTLSYLSFAMNKYKKITINNIKECEYHKWVSIKNGYTHWNAEVGRAYTHQNVN